MNNYSMNESLECSKYIISTDLLTKRKIVVSVLYAIIFVLGVVGNSLVIVTLVKHRSMRTVTNLLLLNLAISDLLIVCLIMPDMLSSYLTETYLLPEAVCKILTYIQAVCVAVSAFTLVTLTIERYFAIVYPLKSRRWQTIDHVYICLVLIWLSSLILPIPAPIFAKKIYLCRTGNSYCSEYWWPYLTAKKIYSLTILLFLHSGPLFIMIVCYAVIGWNLWLRTQNLPQQNNNSNNGHSHSDTKETKELMEMNAIQKTEMQPEDTAEASTDMKNGSKEQKNRALTQMKTANRKAVQMLIVVVIEFFVCWSPVFITNTWHAFDRQSALKNISNDVRVVITLVSYVSTCCNPLTYCFLNEKFRRCFITALGCSRWLKRKRNASTFRTGWTCDCPKNS